MTDYDAIIIGSGAGGGVAAGVLAEAGKHVLLLERGRAYRYEEVGRDHVRNHRLSVYGHNTGPELEGNPRVFVSAGGTARVVRPHEGGWHNNAMAVGGGTRVFGAQAWRFMPQDFRMAGLYGVPEGSSLGDWPIGYDDLAPYYERAEWEVGVSGDGAADRHAGPRTRPYPMPAVPDNPQRLLLQRAAERLGWNTTPVPLLINTVPYNGRPPCVRCGSCVGFACPSEGKNGPHNTLIPRALATGRCRLVTGAMVEKVETDARGRVTGVSYFTDDDDETGTPRRRTARAKAVVVSCGAIESARLLLNSPSTREPRGLGNGHDQVGRHLQGHYYPTAFGLTEEANYDGNGPGVSIATCAFNHGNPGVIGGAMLANDFIELPVLFWKWHWPPGLPRWGLAAKRFMRDGYRRGVQVKGPVQEIPSPESRVTVDRSVRDRWGIPVARLSGTTHPETLRTADLMRQRAEQWLRAAGADRAWGRPPALQLSAGQHQAGTCRMGDDPRSSVTDRWGRVHGHDNLFVVDGALHVTNGGFNPVLTILALAFRSAEHIARNV
jgi:choline dehydrogenase-like flavoprotein